jgi:hypothetical protein
MRMALVDPSGRPKQVMVAPPGTAARQISVDIIGIPPATTRIRQAEPEPQDSVEIASEIKPGLDDIGAEDDRRARRCRELPSVRKLHRQDQQRIPGALGLDVITALFHDQASEREKTSGAPSRAK